MTFKERNKNEVVGCFSWFPISVLIHSPLHPPAAGNCNCLTGLPAYNLAPLQLLFHTAARVAANCKSACITCTLKTFQWLPFVLKIKTKFLNTAGLMPAWSSLCRFLPSSLATLLFSSHPPPRWLACIRMTWRAEELLFPCVPQPPEILLQ